MPPPSCGPCQTGHGAVHYAHIALFETAYRRGDVLGAVFAFFTAHLPETAIILAALHSYQSPSRNTTALSLGIFVAKMLSYGLRQGLQVPRPAGSYWCDGYAFPHDVLFVGGYALVVWSVLQFPALSLYGKPVPSIVYSNLRQIITPVMLSLWLFVATLGVWYNLYASALQACTSAVLGVAFGAVWWLCWCVAARRSLLPDACFFWDTRFVFH